MVREADIYNIEGDYNYGKIKQLIEALAVKNYSIILGG